MTYNFKDRITALEKKSSQGATLSPVKLWSGNVRGSTKLSVPNLNNYRVAMLLTERGNAIMCCRGASTGIYSYNTDSFRVTFNSDNSLQVAWGGLDDFPCNIREVWGIG